MTDDIWICHFLSVTSFLLSCRNVLQRSTTFYFSNFLIVAAVGREVKIPKHSNKVIDNSRNRNKH